MIHPESVLNPDGSSCRTAYGEPFVLTCGDPGLAERLDRFFGPGAGPSKADDLAIEFVEEPHPDPDVNYRDFSYEVSSDRFVMTCKERPCVEILETSRSARVLYDPRWLKAVPHLVDTFIIEAPMLVLLSWFSMPYLHGAAVSFEDKGYVLIGVQGSGKSTLAYASCRLGFSLLAEDHVFVKRTGDGLTLHGQPNSMKLCEDAVSYFPHISGFPRLRQPDGEMKIDVLSDVSRERRRFEAKLRGVVYLTKEHRSGKQPGVERISPEDLFTVMIDDLVFDPRGLARRHEAVYRTVSKMLVGVISMNIGPEKRAELLMEMISR